MVINLVFFCFSSPTNVDGENDAAMVVCSSGTTGMSKGNNI